MAVDDINMIIREHRLRQERRARGEYTLLDRLSIAEDMYEAGLIDKDGALAIIEAGPTNQEKIGEDGANQ